MTYCWEKLPPKENRRLVGLDPTEYYHTLHKMVPRTSMYKTERSFFIKELSYHRHLRETRAPQMSSSEILWHFKIVFWSENRNNFYKRESISYFKIISIIIFKHFNKHRCKLDLSNNFSSRNLYDYLVPGNGSRLFSSYGLLSRSNRPTILRQWVVSKMTLQVDQV